MRGINLMNEMTREDLINEILADQREILERAELPHLKAMVIDQRLAAYRERLEQEAGITVHRGILGSSVEDREE